MEYRVTKYNPNNRDSSGSYLLTDEWTSYFDIGRSVQEEKYLSTEQAYIDVAISMMRETNCEGLFIRELELFNDSCTLRNGDYHDLSKLEYVFRAVLREVAWCKFENNQHFVHFGYDYYMYVGVPNVCAETILIAEKKGLFVEKFCSPYDRSVL